MRKHGLNPVSHRRDDALARMRWDRLELLLVDYYRSQGYRVEHAGTGAGGRRYDGGIDLKLYREDQFIVVQCKGWNAYQVPHNDMHELIGVMMTSRATGAIFVTAGEYSDAALRKARAVPSLQLIDGDELRRMLGPLPEPDVEETRPGIDIRNAARHGFKEVAGEVAAAAGERLLSAAEDRIRGGSAGSRRGGGIVGQFIYAKLFAAIIAFAGFLFAFYLVMNVIKGIGTPMQRATRPAQAMPSQAAAALHALAPAENLGDTEQPPPAVTQFRAPTEAEIRESQRKADEAMKVLEASTPEM